MGLLISAAHRETVAGFVDGEPLYSAARHRGKGFWYPPTIVEASNDDRIAREEVFGPVAALILFEDEAEAVRLANDTPYGLGLDLTRDGARALRVARAIESGVLSVNSNSSVRVATPFGGFKQSGFGRELGMHALEGYSRSSRCSFRRRAEVAGRLDGVCVITGAGAAWAARRPSCSRRRARRVRRGSEPGRRRGDREPLLRRVVCSAGERRRRGGRGGG